MSLGAKIAYSGVLLVGLVLFLRLAFGEPGSSTDGVAWIFLPLAILLAVASIALLDLVWRTWASSRGAARDFFQDERRLRL